MKWNEDQQMEQRVILTNESVIMQSSRPRDLTIEYLVCNLRRTTKAVKGTIVAAM